MKRIVLVESTKFKYRCIEFTQNKNNNFGKSNVIKIDSLPFFNLEFTLSQAKGRRLRK